MFRSGNPALSKNMLEGLSVESGQQAMTVDGAANKTGILFLLLLIGASFTWSMPVESAQIWMWPGLIGGFIVALITIFKKEWSPITAPLYGILEGIFLGAVSSVYAGMYQGIVMDAVMLTLGTFAAMLLLYKYRIINVTRKFRMGVIAATGGIALVYLASFILSFFGINLSLIHGSGLFGIGFSLVIIGVAALNLVLDFDFIERAAENKLPQYFEWYAAFGLIVTLVWLYLEFLRLLSKMQRR